MNAELPAAADALATTVLALRAHLRIAHHVRGRIRLRLHASALAGDGALAAVFTLGERLGRCPAIRRYSVNAAALSVVVEYDAACLPEHVWLELLHAPPAAAATLLAVKLTRFRGHPSSLSPWRKPR